MLIIVNTNESVNAENAPNESLTFICSKPEKLRANSNIYSGSRRSPLIGAFSPVLLIIISYTIN